MLVLLQATLALSLWVLLYHHVLYPWVVKAFADRRRASGAVPSRPPLPDQRLPSAAVVMPAYNEERFIAEKIRNLAALDYPKSRLRILIALDGSKDRTEAAARAALAELPPDHGIELIVHAQNRGKVAVLNQHIAEVASEMVVLTDASALMSPVALRQAAAHFADPDIGVVFGTYRLREAGSEGERAYTDYQTQLRADEGVLDSPMGGHGALYFIRRQSWTPMPPDTINDDFILPMSIVAAGQRAVYDTAIVAEELERTASAQEFRRRVRIGAGNLQQAVRLWRLSSPSRPWLAFTFLSGKGTRPFMPFVGMLAVLCTLALAWSGSWVYTLLLVLELAALAVAAFAIIARPSRPPRIVAWLAYLVEGHAASLVGVFQVLLGIRLKHWQPGVSDAAPRRQA